MTGNSGRRNRKKKTLTGCEERNGDWKLILIDYDSKFRELLPWLVETLRVLKISCSWSGRVFGGKSNFFCFASSYL